MLATTFVCVAGKLFVAGALVSMSGKEFVAGIFVLIPVASDALELVVCVSVELPEVFWLQPTSANEARAVIANNVTVDFICFITSLKIRHDAIPSHGV